MRKKILVYIFAISVFAFILTTGIISFIPAVKLVGKNFPGFFIYPNSFVSISMRQNWPSRVNKLPPLSKVIEINGEKKVEFLKLIGKSKVLHLKVIDKKEEKLFHLNPIKFSFSDFSIIFLIPFITALIFLFTGITTVLIKPLYRPAVVFFILCSLIAYFYFYLIDANLNHTFFRLWLTFPLFGAVSYYLFMIFPEEKNPLFFKISFYPIVIASIALVLMGEIFLNNPSLFPSIFKSYPLYMSIVFIADIAILAIKWDRSKNPLTRKKSRVLLFTIMLASTIPAIWGLTFPFGATFVNTDTASLLSVFFPFMTVYAILKVNVFEIDRVFQKGVGYLFLSAIVVSLYLVLVLTLSLLSQVILGYSFSPAEMIIATLLIAAGFHPMRVKIQNFIKKYIYREDFFREKEREIFLQQLSKTMNVETLSGLVDEYFKKIFSYDRVELFIISGKDFIKAVFNNKEYRIKGHIFKKVLMDKEGENPLIKRQFKDKNLWVSALPEWTELVMTLSHGDKLLGIILLGEPRYPGAPDRGELEVMRKIIPPLSIALENAILHRESLLKERLATIGNVASIIIHEIKNPLGVIKISANHLKKNFSYEESGYELAEFIESETDRIDRISRQILNYAKFGEPIFSMVNLEEIIKNCVDSVFKKSDIVKVECNTEDLTLCCDKNQVEQMLINLFSNSRDAVEETGGRVSVIIEKSKEEMCIIVKDEGPGIDPKVREKIFEPFVTTKNKGTGLGLSIVKNVIEIHSGRIEVEDNYPRGTVFKVCLPLRIK